VSAGETGLVEVSEVNGQSVDLHGEQAGSVRLLDFEMEVFELREYVATDPAKLIDWKATARSDKVYVREPSANHSGDILLVFDHRSSMSDGPVGDTKLDCARGMALEILEKAAAQTTELGATFVGDGGITSTWAQDSSSAHYSSIRTQLQTIQPTGARDSERMHPRGRGSVEARRAADRLERSTSDFSRALRPFYDDTATYIERVESEPLFAATRNAVDRGKNEVLTVIVTDDSNPLELQESVDFARRRSGRVLVLLASSLLYEEPSTANRYEHDTVIQELTTRVDVDAYEIGPSSRRPSEAARRPSGVSVGGRGR
jgi:uncharacterized protein (DUF58 family)